jgi:hypothetical protein
VTTLNMALLMEFLLQNSLLHGKDRFLNTMNYGDSRNLQRAVWSLLGFKLVIHHIFHSSLCKCNFFLFGVFHCVMISHILWYICLHKHPIQFIVWELTIMNLFIVQIKLCCKQESAWEFFLACCHIYIKIPNIRSFSSAVLFLYVVFVQTVWKYSKH